MKREQHARIGVIALAFMTVLALAVPASADSWQEGMLPAPPEGEEAPYYHSVVCDINGDGETDGYGQQYVNFLWKATGKVKNDVWEGKLRFKIDGVTYDGNESAAPPPS